MLDAPVSGKLTLDLEKPSQLEGYLSVGEVHLQGLSPFWKSEVPLGGTATIPRLWVRGPTSNLQGGAQLTAPELSLGGEKIRNVDANISLAKGQVQLQETSFEAAGGRVVVKAAYDYASDPRTIAADVSLLGTNIPDLLYLAMPISQAVGTRPAQEQAELKLALRSYALRLRGMVDGTVKISGPANSPAAVASLKGQQLVVDGRVFPDVTAQGSVTSTGVQDMSVALRQGESLITVDGDLLFDGPINANIEGSGINVAELRPWLPKSPALNVPFGGRLGFTVVASGSTRHPDLTASVDVVNPSFAGVQFDVLSVPVATVREGEIDVDTLVVRRGKQQIVVDGQLPFSWSLPAPSGVSTDRRPGLIPKGQVTLNGRIDRTELAFFLPLIDEYMRSHKRAPVSAPATPFRWATIEAKGQVDSSVSVSGTVQDPTLRGFLRVEDGSLQPAKWKRPLEKIDVDLALTGTGRDNLIEVRALKAAYDQTNADISGRVYLDFLKVADFWRNRFDLTAKGSATDQALPGGLHLTDLTGGLALRTNPEERSQVLTAEGLAFGLGKARATLTGNATLTDFRLASLANNQFALDLNVAPGRVTYGNLLDAVVGGKMQLVSLPGRPKATLKGDWQLSDGRIGLAPGGAPRGTKALSSRFPSPDLDITAGIGKSMSFRSSGMAAPLDANPTAVRIAGTPQRPVLSGNIMARGGQASLPTATLRLSYLGINYTMEPVPGDRNDPVELRMRGSVQGLAETTINRSSASPIRISVNISGSLPDQVIVQATARPTPDRGADLRTARGSPLLAVARDWRARRRTSPS